MKPGWHLSDTKCRDNCLVISLSGFLTAESELSRLSAKLVGAMCRKNQKVVLDCSGLIVIDSAGAKFLNELRNRFSQSSATLFIRNVAHPDYVSQELWDSEHSGREKSA